MKNPPDDPIILEREPGNDSGPFEQVDEGRRMSRRKLIGIIGGGVVASGGVGSAVWKWIRGNGTEEKRKKEEASATTAEKLKGKPPAYTDEEWLAMDSETRDAVRSAFEAAQEENFISETGESIEQASGLQSVVKDFLSEAMMQPGIQLTAKGLDALLIYLNQLLLRIKTPDNLKELSDAQQDALLNDIKKGRKALERKSKLISVGTSGLGGSAGMLQLLTDVLQVADDTHKSFEELSRLKGVAAANRLPRIAGNAFGQYVGYKIWASEHMKKGNYEFLAQKLEGLDKQLEAFEQLFEKARQGKHDKEKRTTERRESREEKADEREYQERQFQRESERQALLKDLDLQNQRLKTQQVQAELELERTRLQQQQVEAERARLNVEASRTVASKEHEEAESARADRDRAQQKAEQARREADAAKLEASASRDATTQAEQKAQEAERKLHAAEERFKKELAEAKTAAQALAQAESTLATELADVDSAEKAVADLQAKANTDDQTPPEGPQPIVL